VTEDLPTQRPTRTFTGAIHRRGILGGEGASYPFGHLEFDQEHLRLWGFGIEASADRAKIKAIRLSPRWGVGTKLTILYAVHSESEEEFVTHDRVAIRAALVELGWHVVEDTDRSARIGGKDYEW